MRPLLLVFVAGPLFAAGDVLIVADESPQMETLTRSAGIRTQIVKQTEIPADADSRPAVIVYIHKDLDAAAEHRLIEYARRGGRLILLHHSISSAKRRNRDWLPFLGVELQEGDVSQRGYKWIDSAGWQMVNLAPGHFITTHGVKYDSTADYGGARRGAIALQDSEVYLNHVLTLPRTVLMGLKYKDPKTGKLYVQDTAAWLKPAGKGTVMYFMAGHSSREFEIPAYVKILKNAIEWRR